MQTKRAHWGFIVAIAVLAIASIVISPPAQKQNMTLVADEAEIGVAINDNTGLTGGKEVCAYGAAPPAALVAVTEINSLSANTLRAVPNASPPSVARIQVTSWNTATTTTGNGVSLERSDGRYGAELAKHSLTGEASGEARAVGSA